MLGALCVCALLSALPRYGRPLVWCSMGAWAGNRHVRRLIMDCLCCVNSWRCASRGVISILCRIRLRRCPRSWPLHLELVEEYPIVFPQQTVALRVVGGSSPELPPPCPREHRAAAPVFNVLDAVIQCLGVWGHFLPSASCNRVVCSSQSAICADLL